MALTAAASDEVGALGGCVGSHRWGSRSRVMNDMLAVQDKDCLRRVARNPAPRKSPVQFFSKVTFAAAPEVLSFVPGSKLVAGAHMVSSRETHSLKGILRRTSAFGVPAPFFTSVSEQFPVAACAPCW